ncbi:MAG: hypothetical protein ACR2LL_08325 [Nitrosopumilus sp.]
MEIKDKVNRISGITSLGTLAVILTGYLASNDSLLGFPNAMMLYALMPAALIWFGTRKNGCGSWNQSCSIPDKKQTNMKNKS